MKNSELIETIKCENGKLCNLEFHQERFNIALKNHFSCDSGPSLEKEITIPNKYKKGIYRCRILYSPEITRIEFIAWKNRNITRLKLVKHDTIDYRFKYSNRETLDYLFRQREDCDDIIIVKNNCVTDSYTANLVFYDGERWLTPHTPLLAGTQRARLLAEQKIESCSISPETIKNFGKVGLINTFWNLENMPTISTKNIVF